MDILIRFLVSAIVAVIIYVVAKFLLAAIGLTAAVVTTVLGLALVLGVVVYTVRGHL